MHWTSTHQVASRLVELIGSTAALYMERRAGSIEDFINREIRCILAYEVSHNMYNSLAFLSSSI